MNISINETTKKITVNGLEWAEAWEYIQENGTEDDKRHAEYLIATIKLMNL